MNNFKKDNKNKQFKHLFSVVFFFFIILNEKKFC